VIADLTDKIKDHPLDVKSLEYSSKLTELVFITTQESVVVACRYCTLFAGILLLCLVTEKFSFTRCDTDDFGMCLKTNK